MPLTIRTLQDANGSRVIVDRRLWLDADGHAVEDGDPAAATLFCSPGKPMLRAVLEAAGVKIGRAKKTDDEKKRDKASTEDKRDKAPTEDKGAGVPGNVRAAKATAGMADADDLDELDKLESDREGGPRPGVTKALAKRREDLEE